MLRRTMAKRFARPGLVWLAAAVWLVAIDAAITRTGVLWGPTTFENARELRGLVFGQAYRAARRFARPEPGRPLMVFGNSRIWLAARPGVLAPLLAASAGAPVPVESLAVFGAGVGDLAMMARHLDDDAARAVVVAFGASDMVATSVTPLVGAPTELLGIGWRDGPLGPHSWRDRLDRWTRTVWPLYRYREFARAALLDVVAPLPDAAPAPDVFPDSLAFFEWVHGKERAVGIEAAYRRWMRDGTLAAWVAYLEVGSPGHLALVRTRTKEWRAPTPEGPGARGLDATLAEIRRHGLRPLVVVMPENPILAQDVSGTYHRPGGSAQALAVIEAVAARHGTPVWDARAAMPASAFLDFDHLFPSPSGFQGPLAAALLRASMTDSDALQSMGRADPPP
jgi:hypothetical protein